MTTVLQTSLPKGPNTGLHWNGQVYAGVTRALAMLDGENRRFARDFMLGFESDVSGDIVALSNDATFNMGITASITIISPPSQAEAHHGAGMQIATGSIPVWSSDGIVVGLDLEYVTGIDGHNPIRTMARPGEGAVLVVGRFCRNLETGEFLQLKTTYGTPGQSGDGMVTLMHIYHISDSSRHQLFMRCDPELLRVSKTAQSFADSAVFTSLSMQNRICRTCGLFGCSCPPQFCLSCDGKIFSPLDFSRLGECSAKVNGHYFGSTCTLFRSSRQDAYQHALVGLSALVETASGPDAMPTLTALRQAGIQNRMLIGLEGNLPRGVMPFRGTVIKACEQGEETNIAMASTPPADVSFKTGFENPFGGRSSLVEDGSFLGRGIAVLNEEVEATGLEGISGTELSSHGKTAEPRDHAIGLISGSSAFGANNSLEADFDFTFAAQPQLPVCVDSAISPRPIFKRTPSGTPSGENIGLVFRRPSNTEKTIPGRVREKSTHMDQAPHIEKSSGRNGISEKRKVGDEILTEYEIGRRRRNRESAARSNQRRRDCRAKLEMDILDVMAMKAELIASKEALEKENRELKALAADKWVHQVRAKIKN